MNEIMQTGPAIGTLILEIGAAKLEAHFTRNYKKTGRTRATYYAYYTNFHLLFIKFKCQSFHAFISFAIDGVYPCRASERSQLSEEAQREPFCAATTKSELEEERSEVQVAYAAAPSRGKATARPLELQQRRRLLIVSLREGADQHNEFRGTSSRFLLEAAAQ